jgi:hypothetical protein
MRNKLVAILLAVALTVVGFTSSAPPAGAASSIYGIHVYVPQAGQQAVLPMSLNVVPDEWDAAFIIVAARISNASGYVEVDRDGCDTGFACSQPTLYRGGSSGTPVYVSYDVNENGHLVIWQGGTSNVNRPRINGDLPQTSATRLAYACDAVMRQLGVLDGCRIDGYPTSDGVAILNWMHAHAH